MKRFYESFSRLKSTASGTTSWPVTFQKIAGLSRVGRWAVLSVLLGLGVLLIWRYGSGDSTVRVVHTLEASREHWIQEVGVGITSPADLGRTDFTRSRRPVSINGQKSIAKVVGIHPEFDRELDAEMVFVYEDADLNGLDETKLVLYSSKDKGITWQPHPNSRLDAATNTIRLEGIRHFSLWTAAYMVVQGPGCVTTGIGAWWRSDIGASAATWTDFSTNGYNATGVNIPTFNTTGANFNPLLKFNGDYYKYTVGIFKNSPGIVNMKVFAVTVPVNGQYTVAWSEKTSNGYHTNLYAPWNNNYSYFDAPYGHRRYNVFTTNGGQYGVPNIVAGERSSNNMAIRTNGKVQNFPGSYGGTFTSTTAENYLGAVSGQASTGGSGLAEMIVYRDAASMTAVQVQKIESYLALKYGITLDQTTPRDYLAGSGTKMWDAAVNGAFKHNITGIGREDCQTLHQKQSKSVNPSQFITFATGASILPDNASNTAGILADNSYLVWADNNASYTTTTAVSGSNVSDRMVRVWKVDKTNWTDQNITIKAAGYANRYLIIHPTSATFATAPSQEILLDATGSATFNSSLLPDGAYFTFGNLVKGPACLSAGIGAWWRADQEMSATSWVDYSGNGYTAAAAGVPAVQATGANYNPFVKFNSTYYHYNNGIFKSAGMMNSKVFTVTVPVSGQLTVAWGERASNGANYNVHAPWNNDNSYFDAPYGHRAYNDFTANGGKYGQPNIITGERALNNMAIRTNGKVQNFPGSYGGNYPSNTTLNYLGAIAGYPSTGGTGVAEVIVYRDASGLTSTDVQKIESYLALKYGITLDQTSGQDYLASDGSKMWDASANAAFRYNIAGLGRDNCQLLHQKQSESVNPLQFITIATGSSVAASNAANTTAVTNDKSFLTWGDNGLSISTTAAVGATNVTDRMERVWRVDKSANWADQNITFQATGYANRYLLIHSSSASFATAPTQEIQLDGTGSATFSSSLLPDGAYFTIGGVFQGPGCVNNGIGGWWRSDQFASATEWKDFSGNDHTATNVGSPVYNTTGANFNPLLKFSGNHFKYTDGVFKNAPGIVNSKVFTVVVPLSGQYTEPWGEYTTNGHNYHLHAPHQNGNIYHDAPYGHRIQAGFTAQGGQLGVPNIIAGERTPTNMSIRTNGKVVNQPGVYGGVFTSHTALNYIGASHGLATSGGSGVAEVIVYRDASAMTATEVQKIESYLALKYGITLDQTTPRDYLASNATKMWDATAYATFKYNIAGLGRDNCQLLHQKQSKSVNPDQFITFALGDSIAASNLNNPKTITNDRSFLVWGDDNANRFASVAVTGSGNVTGRMTRVWRVDKTNWADQNVTFQATGYANRYLLIHNTSASFATAPSQEILLDENGRATFNSSLLPDGAYFTIGDALKGPGCVNAGIGAWWKADYQMAATFWNDYSGNDKNAVNAGAPAPQATGANYNPFVRFSGNHYKYDEGVFKNAPGIVNTKLFTVVIPISGQYSEPWGEWMSNSQPYHIHAPHANGNIYHDAPYGHRIQTGFVANGGQYGVPNIIAGERTPTNLSIRTNGKVVNQAGAYGGTFTANTTLNYIGAYHGLASSGGSGLAEVIVYRDASAMTATDVQKIESYLALKYGITLDQTTPRDYLAADGTTKMWDATVNGAFKYNIAGLGRDVCQQLHQKQSRSVNPKQFITFALGDSIAGGNGNNIKSVTNDKSFFTWADNNTSRFTTVAVTATNVTQRMTRVWKVDKTNWADQTVTFQALGFPNRHLLIHNTSATFATAPSQEIALDGQGKATFSSSLLPDGAYFTIGDAILGPGCVNAGVGAWWKADYEMDADKWDDYSGNDKLSIAGNGAPTPFVSGANYNPMVKFIGSSIHYQYNGNPIFNAGINNARVFAVTLPVSGGNNIAWGEAMNNGYNSTLFAPSTDNNAYYDAPYGYRVSGPFLTNAGNYGVPNLFTAIRTTTNMAIRLQGKQIVNTAGAFASYFSNGGAHIGATPGQGTTSGLGIAELIVYRDASAMTATDLQKIESYLALKYGITLDQTTPRDYLAADGTTKMWNATDNAAFRYNIAGIGKDLCQQLHQKESRSVNPGQFITFGLGSNITVGNSTNTNSVTNDKSFFTWGDNNGTLQASVAVNASNVSERSGRIWRVDKTNWADQDITIQVVGYPNRYVLIHNTDPTFSTAPDQEIQLDGAGFATFSSSLLPDGAYFTLGNVLIGPGNVNVGVASWFDATEMDEGIMVNGTGWPDKSGWHRDMYQINAGSDPDVQQSMINFNKGAYFDGNDEVYQPSYGTAFTAGETFAVGQAKDLGNRGPLCDFGGQVGQGAAHLTWNNTNTIYDLFGTNDRVGYNPVTNAIIDPAAGLTVTGTSYNQLNWGIFNVGAATNDWFSGINGLAKAVRTVNTPVFAGNGNMHIGWRETYQAHANIAEVVHYNRKLTAPERQKVHSYLALKYGITLDQSSPYNYVATNGSVYWDGTANAAFRYNIAGVGRDNFTNLNQKQSKSINAGQFITMSVGAEIAASNFDNASVITNDRSYFVWGDDNSSATLPVAVTGVNVTERMARVWRVDKTANWADQDITFRAQGFPNRYLLIHNTSATFASAPDQEILLDSIGIATFNTSLLPDGAYFTIGDAIKGPGCVNLGVQAWLRADLGTVTPTFWTDYSGNDNSPVGRGSATVNSGSAVNYNPSVVFPGTVIAEAYDFQSDLFTSGNHSISVFSVGTGIGGTILSTGALATNQGVYVRPISPTSSFDFSGSGFNRPVANTTRITRNIYTAGTSLRSMSINGNAPTTSGAVTLNWQSSGGRIIGHDQSSGAFKYNGNLPEMVVYFDVDLTAQQIQRIESYFALKYGITLDQTTATDYLASDGSKMWDATVNAAFKYNIAGLGRDNCSVLHQKQSTSVNASQFITMATGDSIAASNATNAAAITNDRSFLVWGDDNGSQTDAVTVTATNATERMARVFRVDKTNWADQNITVKAQGYGNRYLLISNTSATFATVDQEILLDANGKATFNSSLLPDGAYFTIGDALKGPGCVNLGVKLWFRPDYDVTTAAGKVTQWDDYSGNDVFFGQTIVGEQPTFLTGSAATNFNPALQFSGTTNLEKAAGLLTSGGGTVIAAVMHNNVAATWGDIYNQNVDDPTFGKWHATPNFKIFDNGVHGADDVPLSFVQNQNHVAIFDYGSAAHSYSGHLDGKTHHLTHAAVPSIEAGIAYIGGENTVESWLGNIYEVAIYNRELTASELKRVNSYLALKYGITLDQTLATDYVASDGTTFMWKAADNGLYKNDIAGIGRDHCQALYQKQSRSANADDLITIGNGGIEADNASNTGTLDDLSFLVWGNNDGAIGWQTAESPASRVRLGREWRMNETGTIGTVKLQIPDNGSALTSKLPAEVSSKVYLLVDADGDFSSGATELTMTLNGTNWETDYDFSDGQYFTFATQVPFAPGCVVDNLNLWLKADAGTSSTTDNAVLDFWSDQTTNGYDAAQTVAGEKPSFQSDSLSLFNFNTTIGFSGSKDFVNTTMPLMNKNAYTIFSVLKRNAVTNYAGVFSQNLAGNAGQPATTYVTTTHNIGINAVNQAPTNVSVVDPVTGHFLLRNTGNAGTVNIVMNGGSPNASGTYPGTPTGAVPGYYIGRHNSDLALTLNGNLAEVAVYKTGALTTAQVNAIESYFAVKYGLMLGHDYVSGGNATIWDIGATGGYDSRIFGIGRDDCQALVQKQSKSAVSGALVTLGNGNLIVASNAENSSTFSADASFLMAGDNNGANAWQLAETPANRQRLSREWRVYETGTVGSVKIRVPDNSSALTTKMPGEVSAIYLLTDADGDFSSGSTETAMSLNGTDWEGNVDLTNGQYFTFATNVPAAPGGVVSNLGLWLKANDGTSLTLTGNSVDQWVDRSTNAFIFSDSDGNAGPDLASGSNGRFNFNPYLDFSIGGTRTLKHATAANTILTTQQSMFGVLYKTIDGQTLFAMDNGAEDGGIQMNALDTRGNSSDYYYQGSPTNVPFNEVHIVGGGDDVPGNSLMDVLYDGKLTQNSTASVASTVAVLTAGTAMVGRGLNSPFTGYSPEIIAYTGKLTPIEFQRVSSYLAIKYGITMDQTSPLNYLASDASVIWNAGTNGAYKNDVAGIGRDDASSLEQKQSKSINADALVTMGNSNTIAATNALNTTTFALDKSFMLWGNNNGAIAWQTTEAPSGRQRLTREWRITETGAVGSVKIRIPDNSSALSSKLPAETSTVFLLVDDDGDFSSGATEISLTANGTDWDVDYDLLDGKYITFGTETCNPLITGNPVDVALCAGGNAMFSVTGFGSGLTYQWQESTDGGGSFGNIAGATSSTYTKSSVTGAMDANQYRAVVSNGCPPAATSTAATMTVNTPPVISAQPVNLSVCDGASATFQVTASGSGLTFQWQESSDGGASYTDLSNETGPTLTFTATGAMNNRKYRVVITGTCTPVVMSNAATLTVNAPPTITTQPADITVCAGQNATFTVAATGTNLVYQWQENTGSGFVNIAGATGASYTKTGTTGSMDGYQYQVIVGGDCPLPVTSNSVVITVNTLPAITTQPTAQTVCAGTDATFSVVATGTGVAYQWQESTNGGASFNDIAGATSASHTQTGTTALMSGYQYRVVVSGTCTPPATSAAVILTVNTAPAITAMPGDATICAGGNTTFSVAATGTGLLYQWQENTGASWSNISGATAASFMVSSATTAMSGYQYRVVVSGTCPSPVTSDPAILTVQALPAITSQPTAQTVCAGSDATFNVVATGAGLSYQWQESTNGGGSFSNIGGATTASLTLMATTGMMNAYQYRVIVSGTCTPPVTSTAVTLTVNTAPGITSQPMAMVVCAGQNATFSVTAAGTNPTYQWQENTGSGFVDIPGATSSSYTKTGTTVAMSGHQYQVVITGICPSPVTSDAVALTVNALPGITSQPTAQTVCAGQTATFTAVATGTGVTYQWELNTGSGWNAVSGATASAYTTAATTTAMSGDQYRVVVTGACMPTLTSDAVALTVNALPAIGSQPTAQTVCEGANATFSVSATGTGLSYQWQEDTGSGFVNIAGATGASYTKASTTSTMSGYLYQVIVSGTCAPALTSNPVLLTVNTLPAITAQPTAQVVCAGGNATFSVTATGTGVTYQWQENTGSGFVNIAGATSASYTKTATTTAMSGYQYLVIVTGICPSAVTSATVSLTVNALPAITAQPTAQTACAGENATFSVVATGTGVTYQWQESTDGGVTFINLAGETNATFVNMAVTGGMNGRQYRVIVSGSCTPAVTSNAGTLTVNVSPSITTQPSSQTVCAGQNATFTVAGTGTFLTYQWQENTGSGFVDIAGATNPSYTKASATAAMSGYQYRVVLNGPCVPLNSDVVLLTVNTAPVITSQPTNKTVCAGTDATFTVTATGTGLTYQWQENTGSGFVNIAGETGSSYTKTSTTPSMNGYQYQVVINGTCTPPVTSSLVTLTVNAQPAITAQPNSTTQCEGNNAIFSVTATGSGITYQWQENTGSGFANIPGATASIFIKSSVTPAMSGHQYRVIVSGTCTPAVTSNLANLTVNALPAITAHPAAVVTCEGANVIFSVTATGNGLTYQWEENTGSGWNTISGATSSSYTKTGITNAMNGNMYRVIVSGACSPAATSNAALLTVTTAPVITSQPTDLSVCSGANATFSVTATGTGIAYQWQVNDGFGFVDIPGAVNPSYTKVGVPFSYNGYQYRVIIGGACPPAQTSSVATLSLQEGPGIVTHPASLVACVASNATFAVVASGPGLTYQWQENTGSGFVNISGANSDSYTKTGIIAGMNGYQYRVLVTGICAPTIASNAAIMSVDAPPGISAQPTASVVCEGANATFTAAATGTGVTYQWQENTGSGFGDIAGATGPSYTKPSVTAVMNGYSYRVIATGACSPPATSNAATLTVNVPPAITTQPADAAGCEGANAIFNVTATGAGLTYQWQENTGAGFVNIAGATNAGLTKTAVTGAMNGYQYRVIVSGICTPPLTSNPATLTVNVAPALAAQPSPSTTCIGDNAIFSVQATGSGLTYQWQENTGSGFVNIGGATSDIYTVVSVTSAMNGYVYRVLVNGACTPAVTSSTAALTVISPPAITAQPSAITLCAGGNATFSVTATGADLAYQWQENTGSGFADIVGATGASYTKVSVTGAMNGYLYRVVVSGTCAPPATSNSVLLTVNTAPAVTTPPVAVTVCAGANATFTVTATGTGLAYQWQEDTGSGFLNIAGATSPSYTQASATLAMSGYQYRVIVSGTCTPPVTTGAVMLTVNSVPVITTQPSAATVCAGADATFTVTATGAALSYQWQENTGSGFVDISGATGGSYTRTSTAPAMDGNLYRVVVSGSCTPPATSTAVVLTVQEVPGITTQPAPVATCEGTNATFSVVATGTGLTYQWQENTGSGFVDLGGATGISYTIGSVNPSMNGYQYRVVVAGACTPTVTSNVAALTITACSPVVAVKTILSGGYDEATGKMRDELRTSGLIPNAQPFNGSQYADFGYNGTETIGAGVLDVSGDNAVVDWVMIELHNAANPVTVVARQAALIQRDGDVVSSADGISDLTFTGAPAGDYYVAVRHRNHLGVMTASAQSASGGIITVDFTNASTANYQLAGASGTPYAQQVFGNGKRGLWPGNLANIDNTGDRIIFQGASADPDEPYFRVLLDPGNTNVVPNFIVMAYDRADGDLDGEVIYQGSGSDADVPFFTVFLFPGNTSVLPNYIIYEQIPK